MSLHSPSLVFFFFNDTATTEIYTLSLHDALPIYHGGALISLQQHKQLVADPLSGNPPQTRAGRLDRGLQPRSEGEAEDGAEPEGAQAAERIALEGIGRRQAQPAFSQIGSPAGRIDDRGSRDQTLSCGYGHRVDGEVAATQVCFEGAGQRDQIDLEG